MARVGKARFWTQLGFLGLLHSSWGPELKWFCNPVLSCHSCALAWFACPVGVMIHYSANHLVPYLALGTLLLIGALAGRLLCGWVCPFGFLQDLLHRIPTPKITLPGWTAAIKYVVLVLMVGAFPFLWGEDTAAAFCRFCPASALEVTLPRLVSGAGAWTAWTAIKVSCAALILLAVVFSRRAFCRVLCPIGALMAPFNLISFWKVRPPPATCRSCLGCDAACPTDVQPSRRFLRDVPANRAMDCVVCHDCRAACDNRPRPGSA